MIPEKNKNLSWLIKSTLLTLTLITAPHLRATVDIQKIDTYLQDQENWATISKPHFVTPSSRAYGYRCFIDQLDDKRFIEYTGALVGFVSWCRYYIEDEIIIIVLINVEDIDQFDKIYKKLPSLIYNMKHFK